MARSKTTAISRKTVDVVLTGFGAVATVALITIGALAWWGYSFITTNVHNELAAQHIFFPSSGSPALAGYQIGPYLNKFAGQQLVNGTQARAFADHFIAVHLAEVAGGQTYAEVSAKAMAAPADAKLQAQANTLFKGETLRSMLLNAYAFWTVGYIAKLAAWVCFAAAAVMAVLTLLGFWHMSQV